MTASVHHEITSRRAGLSIFSICSIILICFALVGHALAQAPPKLPELRVVNTDPKVNERLADLPLGYMVEVERTFGTTFFTRSKYTLVEKWEDELVWLGESEITADEETAARIRDAAARGRVEVVELGGLRFKTNARTTTDLSGRALLVGSVVGPDLYLPNICDYVEGSCAYTVNFASRRTEHRIREGRYMDGVWHFKVRRDPARDPEGRSDIIYEGRETLGADGFVVDAVTYRDGKLRSVTRRISPLP